MRNVWIALAVNGGLLALLTLLWAVWNSRRPMTAGRLRGILHWERLPAASELPCGGDLHAAAALLRAVSQGGDDRSLLAALLTRWARLGHVGLTVSPKKRLRAFGEAQQAELHFLESCVSLPPAEQGLYDMLSGWASDGALQRSELYSAARAQGTAVRSRMRQLRQSGVRALRGMGGSFEEGKATKLGFSRDAREIYTAKGVRLARGLAGFQQYARTAEHLTGAAVEIAVLLGAPAAAGDQAVIADTLAAAILDGAAAGVRAQSSGQG